MKTTRGFTMIEMLMALGLMSFLVMSLFAGFAQTSRVKMIENLSTYGDFLSREFARAMSDGKTCNANLVGRSLSSNKPLHLSQIVTPTGVPIVSTAPGEIYYNGITVSKIELMIKKLYTPTEARVVLGTTMNYKGQTRQALLEGFVELSGNKISDCRLLGAKEQTLEEMCNSIKGASWEPTAAECQVRQAGTFETLKGFGSTGGMWSHERPHATICPEGTGATGVIVNADGFHFLGAKLICMNIGENGEPTGQKFQSAFQAGRLRHDSSGWGDSILCPADKWMVGFELKADKLPHTYGSGRTANLYGFKDIAAICGDREHSNLVRTGFTQSPGGYMGSSQMGRSATRVKEVQTCSKGAVLKEIRAANANDGLPPGPQYLATWLTYCN